MSTQNQKTPSKITLIGVMLTVVVLGVIAVQVANQPAPWAKVLASPFFVPKAAKAMGMLATVIVFIGGMGLAFVGERRTTVFHACGALLVCTYAIGLTITLF